MRTLREVWIATPCHGQPSVGFTKSIGPTIESLARMGLGPVLRILPGQAHIDLVRSKIASSFLRQPTEPDVLTFIDADEEWSPADVAVLLEGIAQGLEVVGAAVPSKHYDWEAIRLAAIAGAAAVDLPMAGLRFAYEFDACDVDEERGYVGPVVELRRSGARLVRVRHCGAGFVAIHRTVLERSAQGRPDRAVHYPVMGTALFTSEVLEHATGRRHETEDYSFFDYYRKALGGTIWMHYAARVGHEGLHTWMGDGSPDSLHRQARFFARLAKSPVWRDYQRYEATTDAKK